MSRPQGLKGRLRLGTGNPSDHNVTRSNLEQRQLQFTEVPLEKPDWSTEWGKFQLLVFPSTSNQISQMSIPQVGDNLLIALEAALTTRYTDEDEFDKALFDAMGNGLRGPLVQVIQEEEQKNQSKRKYIVFSELCWTVDQDEYAIGCCRQVTSQELDIPADVGCARQPRHDHSCVLLRRKIDRDGTFQKWQVQQSFATAALKTEKTSFALKKSFLDVRVFASDRRERRKKIRVAAGEQRSIGRLVQYFKDPSTTDGLGALWQELAYVLSDCWTCIARVGAAVNDDTPNSPPPQIPFVVLSGLLNAADKQRPHNFRYVLGNVLVPRVCGDNYSYSLVSGGTFLETDSVETAAAAYLKVISFGIEMGKSLMNRTLSTSPFHSMCGVDVYIGDVDVTQRFRCVGTPFITQKYGEMINQGEMWTGGLSNLAGLPTKSIDRGSARLLMFTTESISKPNLLIKTVSPMIHCPLCSPDYNWNALTEISLCCPESISSVLLAAQQRGRGANLLLLMNNMQPDFIDLHPQDMVEYDEQGITLPILWKSFCNMVRQTLIPMARLDMVHPDIRVGYDITANILVSKDNGKRMHLIDLDSIVFRRNLPTTGSDNKYLWENADVNSFGYLWWQCLVLASMWKLKLSQASGMWTEQMKLLRFILPWTPDCEKDVEFLLNAISSSEWFDEERYITDDEIYDLVVTDDDEA